MKRIHQKYVTIGSYLKDKRENAGLSQGDVKMLLGYKSPQLISDWERGICGPPRDALSKIVKAYKIKSRDLIDLFLSAEREELENAIRGRRAR
jgi:transcriptional regulator with XRE-family HTH domain